MEDNSKDAEVRARVTDAMFQQLSTIATARSEQMPVIVREALNEYLARRTVYPLPGSEALIESLAEKPEIAAGLIALGKMLAANSSKIEKAGTATVLAASAGLAAPPKPPPGKVSYSKQRTRARPKN